MKIVGPMTKSIWFVSIEIVDPLAMSINVEGWLYNILPIKSHLLNYVELDYRYVGYMGESHLISQDACGCTCR